MFFELIKNKTVLFNSTPDSYRDTFHLDDVVEDDEYQVVVLFINDISNLKEMVISLTNEIAHGGELFIFYPKIDNQMNQNGYTLKMIKEVLGLFKNTKTIKDTTLKFIENLKFDANYEIVQFKDTLIKTTKDNQESEISQFDKQKNELLELIKDEEKKRRFLDYSETVQKTWVNFINSSIKDRETNLQKLDEDLSVFRLNQRTVKYLRPKRLTMPKRKNNQGFEGTVQDIYSELLKNVRGSIDAFASMDENDQLYGETKIKAGMERTARNKLLEDIDGWIRKLVYERCKFIDDKEKKEDLYSAARTAVWINLGRYDYKIAKLTTFSRPYIIKAIDNEFRNMDYEVVLPEHAQTKVRKIRRYQKKYYEENRRYPEYQEIADSTELKKDDIITLRGFILREERNLKRHKHIVKSKKDPEDVINEFYKKEDLVKE
jgi:hypothetical protein